MKKFISLLFLLAASLPAFSQHFDWVKTYTGEEVTSGVTTNQLIGSCVDSAGNLYILGEFSPQAQLCGTNLLPFEVIETSRPRWQGVVIAKLSPSGELLWHKAIYNGKQGCYAHALRMVGDSSIMAMVRFFLPYGSSASNYRNLYYLDTLLTGNDDYLMPTDSVTDDNITAFITFDFDGNAIERHLVCVGYLDSTGNELTGSDIRGPSAPDKLNVKPLSSECFNIDSEGNIYIIRSASDMVTGSRGTWRMDDGTISAMKIVVDGTHNLFYPIPYRTALWNQQIMKFSPHFDSLIGSVYMFDSALAYQRGPTINVYSFNVDKRNDMYINMSATNVPAGLSIANSTSLGLGDSTSGICWTMRYSPDLLATGLIRLSYDGNYQSYPQINITDNCIDDTSSLFVSGYANWSSSADIQSITYQNDMLDITNMSGFWLRLKKDDLSLISYVRVLPGDNGRVNYPHLAISKNRVFSQISFRSSIIFGDTTIYTNQSSDNDKAFAIWDTAGNALMFIRYGLSDIGNLIRPPHVRDSIVYLTGSLWEDATFSDITTQNYGYSQVYIAKYVDPAFSQPYEHPSDREEQSIVWQQELSFNLADSPIPLTADATSGLPITYTCNDSSIAYSDGTMLYLLRNGTTTVTASQQGDSDYLPAEPVTKTLQVNDVGTDALANSSPQIFPNPTSGMVTIDLAKTPPATPLPPKQPRRGDTSDINMVLYTSPGAPFSQTESANFPYHQRYNMKVSGSALQSHDGVVTAWLTDMQGRREEVVLTPTGPDQYTLDLTNRPPAAYLLTVTTTDGRELTFRLMKQYGRK